MAADDERPGVPASATLKRRLVLLAKVAVSVGILYWIFTFVSFGEIAETLRGAHVGYFAASTLVILAANAAAAWRMSLLTACQGMNVSAGRIFSINLISLFYGMFLPGSLAGGAIRWRKLYLADRNALGAFVAIILNRFLLTTTIVAVGMAFWLAAGFRQSDPRVGAVFAVLLLGLLLVQGILVWGPHSGREVPATSSSGGIAWRLRSRIGDIFGALRKYRELPRRTGWEAVGLSLVEELLGVLAFLLMALALGISVPLVHLGWVRSFIILITIVPISFLGIGVQEGTLIALLEPYNVTGAQAVAFSFLLVGRKVFVSLLGGVLEARDAFLATPESSLHPDPKA